MRLIVSKVIYQVLMYVTQVLLYCKAQHVINFMSSVARVSNRYSGRSWVHHSCGGQKILFLSISTSECFSVIYNLSKLSIHLLFIYMNNAHAHQLEVKRVNTQQSNLLASKPFFEFSTTSTPNCTISPDLISLGSLSSEPLLSRTLLTKVPLLLLVSCKKNQKRNI